MFLNQEMQPTTQDSIAAAAAQATEAPTNATAPATAQATDDATNATASPAVQATEAAVDDAAYYAWEDELEEQCFKLPCPDRNSGTPTRRVGKSAARIGREMQTKCSRQIG